MVPYAQLIPKMLFDGPAAHAGPILGKGLGETIEKTVRIERTNMHNGMIDLTDDRRNRIRLDECVM